jgi:SAM domain (Sterile alpha motif).
MDLGGWLRSLDLEEYEAAFHKNHIDEVVLPNLTAEDLRDLGVGSIGHRRKLLDAIALLRGDAEAKAKARRLKLLRSLSPLKTPPSAAKSP